MEGKSSTHTGFFPLFLLLDDKGIPRAPRCLVIERGEDEFRKVFSIKSDQTKYQSNESN